MPTTRTETLRDQLMSCGFQDQVYELLSLLSNEQIAALAADQLPPGYARMVARELRARRREVAA